MKSGKTNKKELVAVIEKAIQQVAQEIDPKAAKSIEEVIAKKSKKIAKKFEKSLKKIDKATVAPRMEKVAAGAEESDAEPNERVEKQPETKAVMAWKNIVTEKARRKRAFFIGMKIVLIILFPYMNFQTKAL